MNYIYGKVQKEINGTFVITDLIWTNTLSPKKEIKHSKKEIIKYINEGYKFKTMYYYNNEWRIGEDVHVVDGEYLRTDANNIKADNLANLLSY